MNAAKIGVGAVVAGTLTAFGLIIMQEKPVDDLAKGSFEEALPGEESLFAEVDPDTGEVRRVIVIDAALLNTGRWGNPKNWVRTYATTTPDRARKNIAGIGYIYDEKIDAFIPQKPYESWNLNESTALWEAPEKIPDDGKIYDWDESARQWLEIRKSENEIIN